MSDCTASPHLQLRTGRHADDRGSAGVLDAFGLTVTGAAFFAETITALSFTGLGPPVGTVRSGVAAKMPISTLGSFHVAARAALVAANDCR